MNIRFVLRDSPGKNGYKIRCYIQHNGRSYYNTKYAVKKGEWDERNGRIKEIRSNSVLMNGELIRLRNDIEGLCLKNPSMTATDIVKLIGKNSIQTLKSFWEKFTTDCENGTHKRSMSTVKKYKEALGSIEKFDIKFNRRSDFDTINKEWYDSYTGYLRKDRGVNETTIGTHIKLIKAVMRMAQVGGVSTNDEYKKRYFKKTSSPTDFIYLTEEEILLWEKTDLQFHPHLQAERDRFLLSYFFLLRFGDSLNINKSNVFTEDGKAFIKVVPEKTKQHSTIVVVPVSPKALSLLEKYNYKLPNIENQKANEKLKEIGTLAGISTLVQLLGEVKQKYYFISSHTARRSAATNLYLQGLPLKDLSHLLGHTTISQTEEYIRVSKLESAKKALDFPFFK